MVSHLCPRCSCNLITQPFRDWAVYLCPRCEGVLVDRAVLEELVHQPDLQLSPLRPALQKNCSSLYRPEELASPVECPICERTMEPTQAPDCKEFEIRQCPHDGQVWFDDGELGLLVDKVQLSLPNLPPSVWEGLRRLVGAKPKVQYSQVPPPQPSPPRQQS